MTEGGIWDTVLLLRIVKLKVAVSANTVSLTSNNSRTRSSHQFKFIISHQTLQNSIIISSQGLFINEINSQTAVNADTVTSLKGRLIRQQDYSTTEHYHSSTQNSMPEVLQINYPGPDPKIINAQFEILQNTHYYNKVMLIWFLAEKKENIYSIWGPFVTLKIDLLGTYGYSSQCDVCGCEGRVKISTYWEDYLEQIKLKMHICVFSMLC